MAWNLKYLIECVCPRCDTHLKHWPLIITYYIDLHNKTGKFLPGSFSKIPVVSFAT